MALLPFFGLLYCWTAVLAEVHCPLNSLCGSTKISEGLIWNFCHEQNMTMVERCCMSNGNSSKLLGLDMRNCNLTDVNFTSIPKKTVEMIDLHDNAIKYVNAKEFVGFVKLSALYLPLKTECPGSDNAWNHTIFYEDGNYTACLGQLLPCKYLNVSCTANGECINVGPGSAKCICKPHYFGYKCLQEGIFPTTTFIISLCVPCVVLSALSWLYLRKNVLEPQKEE